MNDIIRREIGYIECEACMDTLVEMNETTVEHVLEQLDMWVDIVIGNAPWYLKPFAFRPIIRSWIEEACNVNR